MSKKVIVFLFIAFLWAWTSWLMALNGLSVGKTSAASEQSILYFFIGIYAPTVSAILTTWWFGGLQSVVALFRKLLIWQVPLRIYLAILVLPLLFIGSGIALYALLIGNVGPFDGTAITAVPDMLASTLISGPLGEELGWRSFLLPELQKKYTSLASGLLFGPIWYLWHIPLFFAPSGTLVSGSPLTFFPLFLYLLLVTCLSCIYTWLFNNAKESVLITILFHLSGNASLAWLFFPALGDLAHYKTLNFLGTPAVVLVTVYLIFKTKLREIPPSEKVSRRTHELK